MIPEQDRGNVDWGLEINKDDRFVNTEKQRSENSDHKPRVNLLEKELLMAQNDIARIWDELWETLSKMLRK